MAEGYKREQRCKMMLDTRRKTDRRVDVIAGL